ncbi:MAG TPA: AI-2E family transporter, partial [Herpetosiphonaceae bacterium]|nr:AI-2E family transporter [Herpetosiphonaceae bacterium]
MMQGQKTSTLDNEIVVEHRVERPRFSWRNAVRLAMVGAALLGVAAVLWLAADALTPFIISLVIAYLMLPAVNLLSRRVPRWAAILLVYVATFGTLGVALSYVIPPAVTQVSEFVEDIPTWYTDGRDDFERLLTRFRR